MIRNYIKTKKNEWKVKAIFYDIITTLIDNQNGVLELLQKLYVALKDVPVEELQKEFINKLAEIIQAEDKDKTE